MECLYFESKIEEYRKFVDNLEKDYCSKISDILVNKIFSGIYPDCDGEYYDIINVYFKDIDFVGEHIEVGVFVSFENNIGRFEVSKTYHTSCDDINFIVKDFHNEFLKIQKSKRYV